MTPPRTSSSRTGFSSGSPPSLGLGAYKGMSSLFLEKFKYTLHVHLSRTRHWVADGTGESSSTFLTPILQVTSSCHTSVLGSGCAHTQMCRPGVELVVPDGGSCEWMRLEIDRGQKTRPSQLCSSGSQQSVRSLGGVKLVFSE